MSHVRTQIRQAFKAALDADLGAGYAVFASRKFKWNTKPSVALIDMQFLNDQTQAREVMSNARVHVASLYIRVQRAVGSEGMDDALDADQVLIEAAIEAQDWSALLEEPPELVQVNFSDSGENLEQPIGAIVLRYDLEYRIDKTDPETILA